MNNITTVDTAILEDANFSTQATVQDSIEGSGNKKKRLPKGEKIPDIGLSSFVTFKETETSIEIYPAPTAIANTNGKRPVLTLGNIPLPAGVPAPAKAITLLYGFRDALEEMKMQYATASQKGHELVKVEFNLQVNTTAPNTGIVVGTAREEDLPRSRFLNILRLDINLQREIMDALNDKLSYESRTTKKAATYFERIVDAGGRPDLLCDVIRETPIYAHINSVVYSVPDGTPLGRKVCTVFDTTDAINLITRGDAPFDIELPKLVRKG